MELSTVFFSYAFPPLKYPRSIQVSHLARYTEYPLRVICAEEKSPRDESLTALLPSELEVHRFPRETWLSDGLRSRLPMCFRFPDLTAGWARQVGQKMVERQLISSNETLVTFGNPMSDHLVGLDIKHALGVPWIAHFSDPWVDNPYLNFTKRSLQKVLLLEREIIENSDYVVFTSSETEALVMGKYPAEWKHKSLVIPHCYDASLYPKKSLVPNRKVTFRYLGNLYGLRSSRYLVDGVEAFLRLYPQYKESISFEVIGGSSQPGYSRTCPLLFHRPAVSYLESLQLMVDADVLVVLDAPAELNVFFPSKLSDYIGSGRKILGITPTGSSQRIIEELGGEVANPLQPEDIANSIHRIFTSCRSNSLKAPVSIASKYSVEEVVKSFDGLLGKLR